jgi:hypothetical protein
LPPTGNALPSPNFARLNYPGIIYQHQTKPIRPGFSNTAIANIGGLSSNSMDIANFTVTNLLDMSS